MKTNDTFDLVNEMLEDGDPSLLQDLENDKRLEYRNVQKQLRELGQQDVTGYTSPRGQELVSQLDSVQNQLEFYRQLRERHSKGERNETKKPDSWPQPLERSLMSLNTRTENEGPVETIEQQFQNTLKRAQEDQQRDQNPHERASEQIEARLHQKWPSFFADESPKRPKQPQHNPPRTKTKPKANVRPLYRAPTSPESGLPSRIYALSPSSHSLRQNSFVQSAIDKNAKEKLAQAKVSSAARREEQLNKLLIDKEAMMEDELIAYEQQYEAETQLHCQTLLQRLEEDHAKRRKQLEVDLVAKRHNMEQQVHKLALERLEKEKERMFSELLAQEEAKVETEIQQLKQEKLIEAQAEKEKVLAALEQGRKHRFQQMKKRLASQIEHDLKVLEDDEEVTFQKNMDKMKDKYAQEEAERFHELKTQLRKRHEVELYQLQTQLQQQLGLKLTEERTRQNEKLSSELKAHETMLLEANDKKLAELEHSFQFDITNQLQTLTSQFQSDLDNRLHATAARFQQERHQHFQMKQQEYQQHIEQCVEYLAKVLDPESGIYLAKESHDHLQDPSPDFLQLEHQFRHTSLSIQTIPEFRHRIETLLQHYRHLHEQHAIVTQRLALVAQEFLRLKRTCNDQEKAMHVLRNRVATVSTHEKQQEAACRRLFQANQVLIEKLQKYGNSADASPQLEHQNLPPMSSTLPSGSVEAQPEPEAHGSDLSHEIESIDDHIYQRLRHLAQES